MFFVPPLLAQLGLYFFALLARAQLSRFGASVLPPPLLPAISGGHGVHNVRLRVRRGFAAGKAGLQVAPAGCVRCGSDMRLVERIGAIMSAQPAPLSLGPFAPAEAM